MLIVFPSHADNEYFDHVHIRQIARGVPEDKVGLRCAVHILNTHAVRQVGLGNSSELHECRSLRQS